MNVREHHENTQRKVTGFIVALWNIIWQRNVVYLLYTINVLALKGLKEFLP
jgi:hypothetical protein